MLSERGVSGEFGCVKYIYKYLFKGFDAADDTDIMIPYSSVAVTETSIRVVHAEDISSSSQIASELITVSDSMLLLAKSEAVYGYSPDQGNVSAVSVLDAESPQVHLVSAWKQYLLLFHIQNNAQHITILATYPSTTASGTRFIASQTPVGDHPIVSISVGAFDGHSVILFAQKPNGEITVSSLREKPISEQLSLLTSKCLFEVAVDVAVAQAQSKEVITELFRVYGDSHFEKGEFDKAVGVYSRTIDLNLPLESSYVVNKLLLESSGYRNSDKVEHVAKYLQKLHQGSADVSKDHTLLLILSYQSLGREDQAKALIGSVKESVSLGILSDIPSLISIMSTGDLTRIFNACSGKRLLETLIENQQFDHFTSIVAGLDKQRVAELMRESRLIKSAILQAPGGTKVELADTCLSAHLEFCKTRKVPTVNDLATDTITPDYLTLLLELTLRGKGNSREIVRVMINRGLAGKALYLCKLFGAPARIILLLTTALNTPFDALAYPAMPLGELGHPNMAVNALAVQKRSGVKSGTLTLGSSDDVSVSVLIETADAGTPFGTIKGALLAEFQKLEESIDGRISRSENDAVEIERMNNEIAVLRKRPQIHQLGRPCALCKVPLTDFPIVLYKCMHGYHQHCATGLDGFAECRVCHAESQHHRDVLNQRKSSVNKHDEMFKSMSGSKGGRFDVAMAYLGHGLFSH